ncbi:hypothetical protein [Paraburkholderia phenoliruptrix]|uniref:RpiR family transcriptional regulator n=2 Tax=Paraburkholderia phenoliruptrix TaxID=252970 RepID=K0E0E7_9BURK|nr:hypothetical protein [Paraburkholderia phenoliruptrix]AFT90242.1 hypothetical protein BUPH_06617 [Paraburkholderia phenoliruptrix BR3459a]CAB4052624.1 hypothetical protein LMG9964_06314 [Paraburkholderia phenoliruptrix]
MSDRYLSLGAADCLARSSLDSLFEGNGWQVEEDRETGGIGDFVLTDPHGRTYYAVLKTSTEGRSDRVIPLFSQALLEARLRSQQNGVRPAVLIWVGTASTALVKKLMDFHRQYGQGEPFAILAGEPLYADFPGLDHVANERSVTSVRRRSHSAPPPLVFSDLAQWMLKLLLAADISREGMINAPGRTYLTATDLAREARVSVMSATRLINALKEENFIESAPYLRVVQRRKLAQRWKAAYLKPAVGLPMKYLAPGVPEDQQLRKLLKREGEEVTLGQFAAADALGVGHVRGFITTLWVPDLAAAEHWRGLRLMHDGERADVVLRQHPYPQSLGRGRVLHEGKWVSDIIQTWLDVSADPSRGAEQAAEFEHGVLANVVGARA